MTTKRLLIVLLVIAAFTIGHAQSNAGGLIMLGVQSSISGCTWPTTYLSTGGTFANAAAICPLPNGIAYATNGGPFQLIGGAPPTGVTSFNTRTGTVVPAANDYSYSQLSAPPTTINCAVAAISTGTTGTFGASGCTIK